MMKAVRVTEEWQRAGVHYVRTQAMCLGFKIPLEGEFSDDTPEDEYILVMDGIYPYPPAGCIIWMNIPVI